MLDRPYTKLANCRGSEKTLPSVDEFTRKMGCSPAKSFHTVRPKIDLMKVMERLKDKPTERYRSHRHYPNSSRRRQVPTSWHHRRPRKLA
jgi:hypothetical protein